MKQFNFLILCLQIFAFGCTDKPGTQSSNSGQEILFNYRIDTSTTRLHVGEGEMMVWLYSQHPIAEFKTADRQPIKAFEFDTTIINEIRQDSNIVGIRVYLAKEPRGQGGDGGLYSLVATPYYVDGQNKINDAFEWHKPCPPCTVDPATSRKGDYRNPNDYGNDISVFFSEKEGDSIKAANK